MKTTLCGIPLAALLLLAALSHAAAGDDAKTVDLTLHDTPVRNAIVQIAKMAGKNVILSPKVEGSVTLELKDVPWHEALEQVAGAVGARVVDEPHGVVRVVPADEVRVEGDRILVERGYVLDGEGKVVRLGLVKSKTQSVQLYDVRDLSEDRKRALHDALDKLLEDGGHWEPQAGDGLIVVRAPLDLQARVRELLERLRAEAAAGQPTIETVTEDGEVRVRVEVDGASGPLVEKRVMQSDGKGGWVPLKAGANEGPMRAERKRIEDLMAAAKHLQAAGAHEEAKRLHERIRDAQRALADAEQARKQTEAALARGFEHLAREQGVEGAIQALREDVHALRAEVRELTDLVRRLLER